MFERFTDRARRVVVLAQEEARMLNHGYIGTEHLLLGLVHEGEGLAAKALETMDISLEKVRHEVEALIGEGKEPPGGHIPFTPRAKKVLELSLKESNQLGHNYIGTEHILLGVIREGHGVAAQVLVKLGADLKRMRQQVLQLDHGYAGDAPAEVRAAAASTVTINDILERLAAVERWVGIGPDTRDLDQDISQARRDKEAAIETQDFEAAARLRDSEKRLIADKDRKEKDWAAGLGDRPPLAEDFLRLSAELTRLRRLLRDHGIEPGDDAAAS
jgi:ATP-dependent Clp protease ATP-binding subunit ClpA